MTEDRPLSGRPFLYLRDDELVREVVATVLKLEAVRLVLAAASPP